MTTTAALLNAWSNFYVIVGSAAGGLTGLQFVVMTLIKQTKTVGSRREIRAFGTPTVVHFCAALLISGIMNAPWWSFAATGYVLAICGVAGFAYSASAVWHAAKADYVQDLGDRFWYGILPFAAYGGLTSAGAAVILSSYPTLPLFAMAAITLLFLFMGIHNAWDTVTYIALQAPPTPNRQGERPTETPSSDDIN